MQRMQLLTCCDTIAVILDSKLMTNVTSEMFAEGVAVAQEALKGSSTDASNMNLIHSLTKSFLIRR